MFTKIRLILFMAVTAFLLAACAQPQVVEKEVVVTKEVEKEVTVVVAPERIDITMWVFGSEGSAKADTGELWSDFYSRVINEYEKQHPGVNINFFLRGVEAGGTTTFVDAAVAAGTPPDIYYDGTFRIQKYAQAGLLELLDGAITEKDKAAYDPGILSVTTGPDGIWALPIGTGYVAYVINKTMFEEAGLGDLLPQEPDRNWTTDEFLKACRAINDPPNRYCTMFFAKTPSFDTSFNNWFGGFPGCDLYDKEKQEYVANSPECVEAMTFLHSLQEEGLTVPGPSGFVDDDQDGYWKRQEIAMTGGGFWYNGVTTRGLEDGSIKGPMEYLLVNYPHKPGAPPTPMGTWDPHAWSVFKQDNPKKLAVILDFINYLQQPEIGVQIAAGWNEVSVRNDALNPWADDPDWAWVVPVVQKYGAKNYYYSSGVPCNYNEVRLAWAEARQAFWEPDADIQQILDDFVGQANGIIAECD
ncbi:MAG: extracellular solute-binding protein [Chloroflexi bacterium]|nr:extracellular solute-binding protein [Chloroflexota bacterium]